MSYSFESYKNNLMFDAMSKQRDCLFQIGQRVIYEDEEAEIIRVKPILTIKLRNRVVCGALCALINCKHTE
ncbi:MAG: hypothetical protein AMJ42_06065 [Deltaproteobacteria bacterium DG_8]|nr:MAG: hypothetical protein AMJ42_06065 [Deltaproteobacteria bacterium DG_8]